MTAGETYACPRCHGSHVIEQPHREASTAERLFLYVTCRGQQYFVGQAIDERTTRG